MDIIDKYISNFLNKIAKTKEDSLVFGGIFVGFALGMCFFSFDKNFDLMDIFKIIIVTILLFSGAILIFRGRR